MSFRGDDDYEYVDDEEYYGDEEDDDEDEELGGDWRSRLGSRSSNLPGPGRDRGTSVLGGSGSSSPSRNTVYGQSDSSRSPGGQSSSPSNRSKYSSGGSSIRDRISRPGDTGPLRGSGSSSSGTGDWRSRINTGDSKSSGDTGPLRGSSPSSDTGPLRGSSSSPSSGGDWRSRINTSPKTSSPVTSKSSDDSKKDDWRSKLSSPTGGDSKKDDSKKDDNSRSNRLNAIAKAGRDGDKKDDKKSDGDSGGGMLGGFRSRIGGSGGDTKKDDPKKSDSKKADGDSGGNALTGAIGGFRSRMGGSGGDSKKDDPKKSDSKKADGDSGGGMLGGFRSRMGGSGDGDSKKDDPKKADNKKSDGDSSGGMLGGFRSRMGSSGGDTKKDDPKKSDSKKADGDGTSAVAAASGLMGGFRKRIGGSGDDKKADDKKDDGKFSNRKQDAKAGGKKQSKLGATKSAKSDDKKADKAADDSSGGGMFSNLFSRVRGGDSSEEEKKPEPKKERTSKAPKVEADDWLDLDRKLDLVGVGLVFGSILLFFSAMSQEQAAISFIHNMIGQLFGWGALAVPATMFAVGMWLIVRHFGDDAPTVDPLRLAGIVIGFIGVLTLFQYMESFNYIEAIPDAQAQRIETCSLDFQDSCTEDIRNLAECDVAVTPGCLEGLVKYSYEESAGGGLVGGWLYLTLVSNLTEIGGFVVVAMVLTFALMMMTRLSMAEIAVVFIGIGRSLRTSMAQNAARRRAQRLREEQQKALAAEAASVSVSKPAPAQLPGFQATNALPEPSEDGDAPIPIEERDILIRRGGQAFSSAELQQEPVLLGATAQVQPQQQSSGVLGRLFGRNKQNKAPVQPQPQQLPAQGQPNVAPAAVAATASAGIMGRLFNRGGNDADTQQIVQQPQQPQTVYSNNVPVGGNIPQEPVQSPVHQPVAQPNPMQQPVAQVQSGQPAQQPQQVPMPPVQEPVPQQEQADGLGDIMSQRQDRLNAIRSGMTAPQAAAQAQPVASNGGNGNGNNNDYNPFGRPDDIPTHESENLPGQQFSTTTPVTTQNTPQPQINPQKNPVQKPVSSGPVNQSRPRVNWKLPDYRTLLSSGSEQEFDREHLLNQARIIEETLGSFGAPGRVVEVNTGPVITQFGVEPDYLTSRSGKKSRVKVSAIAQLDKDLQLALGAKSIRVEAPVPGKGYVGIEVPNTEASLVSLRDVMESESFQKIKTPLAIALGMSVDGTPISADLTQMPHLLIAGTTGSGKSVCVNAIINSIVATNSPENVKFIMVDPKRVELTGYNGLPHLVAPVVVELERIVGVLKWVTREMDERYKKFSNMGARNIIDYNKHRDENLEKMPYIVVIIDELADLMMLAPEETERTITRIAALARATGIHLVIATQRPSVDVVTGLIKANFPARIAFAVAGGVDSRVILDQPGAERLLGKGDMLYLSGDSPAPLRLQGVYVSDMEINNITRYWKAQSVGVEMVKPISVLTTPSDDNNTGYGQQSSAPTVDRTQQSAFWDASTNTSEPEDPNQLAIEDKTGNPDPQEDELYQTAVDMVRRLDKASISLLQRRLRIGYTRAARLIDMMEERGVVGPAKEGSSKPRDVIPE